MARSAPEGNKYRKAIDCEQEKNGAPHRTTSSLDDPFTIDNA